VRTYLESQPEGTEFDPDEITAQFEWVHVVPITPEIAREIAEREARLHESDGVNQDRINALAGDAIIAGAAVELDATVVTRNVEDFRTLGVPAETY
jgi:hypothetical protein